jgi:hypothetical protein
MTSAANASQEEDRPAVESPVAVEGSEAGSGSPKPRYIPDDVFPGGIKVVYSLPRTDAEIQAAHLACAADACETIPPGELIERRGFFPYLTIAERDSLRGTASVVSSRQHLFSVGIDFLDEDRRDLPLLSGGEIVKFFHGRYVMLQARVRKTVGDDALFLHHRPLGGMTQFVGSRVAEMVTTGVEQSFRHYRALGLVLKPGDALVPENLRTLAIIHKSERLARTAASAGDLTYRYEYVFVRAQDQGSDPPHLDLHTFITSGHRRQLHYIQLATSPTTPNNCSVTTMIRFTEYMQFGLRPKASATRRMVYQDRSTFAMAQLDQFARQQGWSGNALDNLSATLDAIIAGEVTAE